MELLSIDDAGVHLEVNRKDDNQFSLKISVKYNFVIAYQKTWMELEFNKFEFKNFVESVVKGVPSKHGYRSLWLSKLIVIKKPLAPVGYREIKLVDRLFIIGFRSVPATFSNRIVSALSSIVV